MSRVSTTRLVAISEGMTDTERVIVQVVDRLRLVSHGQLARLAPSGGDASPASAARTIRRTLLRLTELGVLSRLDRRIGGIRAGSAGHVYYLGPVGQRLIAYWNGDGLVRGRVRPEPGAPFVRHRLATSELYVAGRERERLGDLDLMAFDVEPACWRQSLTGLGGQTILKPDAFLRVGVGAYEDRWFIEVDLGTESRTVLARKLRAYLDYFHTGAEQATSGVFPRVLWLTTTDERKAAITDLCAALPEEYWSLFAINLLDRGMDVITGLTEDGAHEGAAGEGAS